MYNVIKVASALSPAHEDYYTVVATLPTFEIAHQYALKYSRENKCHCQVALNLEFIGVQE